MTPWVSIIITTPYSIHCTASIHALWYILSTKGASVCRRSARIWSTPRHGGPGGLLDRAPQASMQDAKKALMIHTWYLFDIKSEWDFLLFIGKQYLYERVPARSQESLLKLTPFACFLLFQNHCVYFLILLIWSLSSHIVHPRTLESLYSSVITT